MPEPRISSHPVALQMRQPAPLQPKQRTSTSAEGSVNGKKDGRKRIRLSAPNSSRANSSSVPLRSRDRDVAVHHQPLDLVEHRRVRLVEGVAAIDAARAR